MQGQEQKITHIASIGTAVPPRAYSQTHLGELAEKHYQGKLSERSMTALQGLFAHPSIRQRRFGIDDIEDLVAEDPDRRMARFTHWSQQLSANAVRSALAQAKVSKEDVDALVVNTCTGYICPGIATYLIETLGLSRSARAYDLVGTGCGGAIPNLEISEAILKQSETGVVISLCVEICSATFQMDDDLSLLLSNVLFADGAAAAVLWTKPEGYELVASARRYVPEKRDAIRYAHKNGQLHNQISVRLPDLLRKPVAAIVSELLAREQLKNSDIQHWAIHTGGEKIINAVQHELGISEEQIISTRSVLSEYGNMSSPTVWFVLRELEKRGIESGAWCMMLAFGAGLSVHAFLIRKK